MSSLALQLPVDFCQLGASAKDGLREGGRRARQGIRSLSLTLWSDLCMYVCMYLCLSPSGILLN